jgi:hypothetical protein
LTSERQFSSARSPPPISRQPVCPSAADRRARPLVAGPPSGLSAAAIPSAPWACPPVHRPTRPRPSTWSVTVVARSTGRLSVLDGRGRWPDADGVAWWMALSRRSAAVLLLTFVGVLATWTDAVAAVAPDWTAEAASPGAVPRGLPTAVPPAGLLGDRWSWPLQPRPPVMNRFDPPAAPWGSGHRGVDLRASAGQHVVAPTGGVVAFRGTIVDRGVLVLETLGGLRITFEPVDSALEVGTSVEQGQVVGTVSTVPGHCPPATCLHWGVVNGDTYLDPLAFVGAVRVVLLPLRPP